MFEKVTERLGYVVSVGRLDFNSEGLLLLTNDGALARDASEHPSRGWRRRYRPECAARPTRPRSPPSNEALPWTASATGPIQAQLDRQNRQNAWLTLSLTEAVPRDSAIVLAHLGLSVNRLIRTAYGPFQLGGLPRGEIAEIPPRVLREQLGGKRRSSGADCRR